jgi:VWFA-related protein
MVESAARMILPRPRARQDLPPPVRESMLECGRPDQYLPYLVVDSSNDVAGKAGLCIRMAEVRMQIPIYLRRVLPICAVLAGIVGAHAQTLQQNQQTQGAPPQQTSEQSTAPLRAETHAVLISVAVRDSSGRAVEDLRKEDFSVMDNGKPRDFQLFPGDVASAVARPAPLLAPNFFSNHYGPIVPAQRATAILIDAVSTPLDDQMAARAQAIKAVENMTPGESIAIYCMTTKLTILQDYTANRDLLLKALRAYTPEIPMLVNPTRPSSPNSAENGAARGVPGNTGQGAQAEAQYFLERRVATTLATLLDIATHMGGASHRNSIIWITSGFPVDFDKNGQVQSTLEAINDANIAIYPIDARGLSTNSNAFINIQVMQRFAETTGGQAFYNRNDLDNAIAEAMSAPQSNYVLGFYLSDSELDHRFHKLHVATDRPGLSLHYRSGYTAALDPNTHRNYKEPLDAELLDTQDSTSVGIDAQVNSVKGPGGKPQLHLGMSLVRNTLTQSQAGNSTKVDLSELFAEMDAQGQTVARITESISFDMPAGNRDPGYSQVIPLAPGAESLKVIVQEKASGRTGSLTIPLANIVAR